MAAALLLTVLTGCGQDPVVTTGTTEADSSNTSADFDCSDKLNSALEMVQPERLGVTTDAETTVSRLNTWLEDCGQETEIGEPAGPTVEKLLTQVFSETEMNRLESEHFGAGDAEHLRDCQLHKALANVEFEKADSELDNIVSLFHFCMNNIALHLSEEEKLPLNPYEILLFGRGTPEDAAWVFIDLLRQLEIDAVILRPAEEAGEEDEGAEEKLEEGNGDDWLIGVLWNKQVYLFDPRLGTPIPGPKDEGKSAVVRSAATLAEVVADDSLLRKLDTAANGTYPLSSERLKKVSVHVVGTRSLWSSPMKRLQVNLSGERSAVVYDGLQDDGKVPGLIARVTEAGGERWSQENINIWAYPQRQIDAAGQRDEAERQRLAYLEAPHDAPFSVALDEMTRQPKISKPGRRHFKTRMTHLLGDFDTAIRNYQTLRIRLIGSAKVPFPPEIKETHQRAAEDAAYWIGLCQFDQGKYEQAASTFRDYIRRYEKSDSAAWTPHARLMLALSAAETGELGNAEFELTLKPLPGPLAGRQRFLSERWNAAKAE